MGLRENTAKQEWGDGESLGKDVPAKTLPMPQPWLKTSSKREFGFLMSPKRGWVCLVPGLVPDSYLNKSPSSDTSLPAARLKFSCSELLTCETSKARARTLHPS